MLSKVVEEAVVLQTYELACLTTAKNHKNINNHKTTIKINNAHPFAAHAFSITAAICIYFRVILIKVAWLFYLRGQLVIGMTINAKMCCPSQFLLETTVAAQCHAKLVK